MNDRYLFKAQRTDNGEWVEGHLITDEQEEKKHFIAYIFGTDEDGQPHDIDSAMVDPFTICQCTGLKDDNNNLIFENDILFLKDKINGIEWKAIVRFGNPNGEYTYGWQLVPIAEFDGNKDILLWVETELEYMQCEIVGNRFDNPKLLEVQEEG